tara:strand:+ start:1135 stop:1737 length:603 start_codon:yes stop_codon:yes gene_type:complete
MSTILVQHRINTIQDLHDVPINYGVEVDIREQNGDLICAHDPFEKGELFKNFLSHFKHKFLIANIKEEGIEKSVISCIKDQKIENYFLLDVTFPYLVKLAKEGINKIALRVSDYENLNLNLITDLSIEWIWLDAFSNFPIEELNKIQAYSSKNKIKVCLVSPELHMSRSNLKSERIHDQIKATNYSFDAICTKKTTIWQK